MMQKSLTKSYSIDTRTLLKNDIFVALNGKHVNGHKFVSEAIAKGASAAIVQNNYQGAEPNLLRVDDPLRTLQILAQNHLRIMPAKRIALTGSNGKTTTKDLIDYAIKSCLGEDYVLSTFGNMNNHIGLPLTALRVQGKHKIVIFEMGMNQAGEIAELTKIAQPHVALITMIGSSHLGNLGSKELIAKEKAELFKPLKSQNFIIINADDSYCIQEAEKNHKSKRISFGYSSQSDVQIISDIEPVFKYKNEIIKIKLDLLGKHNIKNAAAAFAVVAALDLDLKKAVTGMQKMHSRSGRLRPEILNNRITILDDSYNASPESIEAALDVLQNTYNTCRKIVILGDMGELGKFAKKKHFDVGVSCAGHKIDHLFACGNYGKFYIHGAEDAGMSKNNLTYIPNIELLALAVISQIKKKDVLLIKGSRFSKMEILIEKIKKAL